MNSLFTISKLPYFLTLLFTIVGLQANYLVNSILKTPVIEYKMNVESALIEGNKKIKTLSYIVTNITKSNDFKNLQIKFRYRNLFDGRLFDPNFRPTPPSSFGNDDPLELDSVILVYQIKHLQPGYKYNLVFNTYHDLNKNIYPEIYLDTTDTVRIMKRSFYTIVVKNHLLLNFVLILMWLFLIIIYLRKITHEKRLNL